MTLHRRLGRMALVLAAGAFAAPTLAAQLPHRDLTPVREVRQVNWNGVSKWVDRVELQASIYTEPSRCRSVILNLICRFTRFRPFEERHYFNQQELQRDVLRLRVFYYKHGYREAQVDTTITRIDETEVAVRFDIHEGAPTVVKEFSVTYNSTRNWAASISRGLALAGIVFSRDFMPS